MKYFLETFGYDFLAFSLFDTSQRIKVLKNTQLLFILGAYLGALSKLLVKCWYIFKPAKQTGLGDIRSALIELIVFKCRRSKLPADLKTYYFIFVVEFFLDINSKQADDGPRDAKRSLSPVATCNP